jgi:heat shock protein HslJ
MKNSTLMLLFITLVIAGCKPQQKTVSMPPPPPPLPNVEMVETYWKLTELMGQPIVKTENMRSEIHIILKKEGNRVQGFSGCNTIMGGYELKEGNRITFSQMASTMMACDEMETESLFNKMLGEVDNYSIKGNSMTLNRARMAPMARFEAVLMK